MGNTLMFQIGIEEVSKKISDIRKEFDDFNNNYGKGITVKLNFESSVGDIEALIKSLKNIGNPDALKPYEQALANIKGQINELNKVAAESTFKKSAQDAQNFETALGRIETVIGGLKGGMSVTLAGDFANWAAEVQNVTRSVKELVEQLQKMNTSTPAQAATEATKAQTQAVLEESDAYKQLAKWREQAEKFHKEFGKTGNGIIDWHASGYIREPFTMHNGNGNAYTDLDVIKNHVYALKEESTLLKERQALIDKFSGVADVGQKQRYNQILAVYNEVYDTMQKLKQEENKPAQKGGILDPQQFTALQEAITKIIGEINRLKESFAGIGEITGITKLTEAINTLYHNVNNFKDVFATLSSAVNLTPTSEYVKKLQTDFEAAQAKVQELTDKMAALAAAQKNVAESASKAGKSEKQVEDSQTALFNRYQKLFADIQNIKREIVEIQRSAGGGGGAGDELGKYYSRLNQIRNQVREIAVAPSVAEAIQRGMSTEMLTKLIAALANIKATYKSAVSDAKDFNSSVDKGSSQAEARIRKLGMAFNELKNYMRQNGGSEEMRRLQQEIQVAIQKMRQLMNAGDFKGAVNVYERLSGIIRQAAIATKEFERSQQGVSSTVSHTNSQLRGQSQILSDLRSMAMQYLSVWGAQSFINNIIELGGQLEQQRLSIGAILQDTAQANHLFGQIKDLAIKSPFGVQQLDQMSKQLSAYGFKYSELYEWTKRLADISAATGTSVDRLALALGHVRSEGALSGYTLRQFSMGNIPLLEKLSEKLGKTKQEIRKMTRNKEIGYEDVLDVLKQLTDESGMFYNAQEVMSQALNAKFKNLRDSFQIMYSEMAEGAPGDFLKGVATVLTDISKSWRVLMPVILSGAGALGVWKLSTMALNYELAKEGVLTSKAAAEKAKYAAVTNAQIAATGRWTLALRGLKTSLASIGKFMFNPITLGFAAVEGLIYLWSRHNEEVRKAGDLTKAYGEAAVESEKNIAKQLAGLNPFSNKLNESELKTGIDTMTESIKNYAINGQSIINGMFSKDNEGQVMSLAEKYDYLREELWKTMKVYQELKRVKDSFEYGITKSDGGWLDDDVNTDLTQYSEAYKKFVDDVTEYDSKYNNSIEKAVKNAQNSDKAFREATKNMESYGEMLAEFWSNPEKYQKGIPFMNNLFGAGAGSQDALDLNESFFGYLSKKNEAMKELDQFIENTETRLKEKGYDFSKELAPEQVGALLKMSKDWLERHPEWENIYGVIEKKLEHRWPIKFEPDASPIEEELPEWMQKLQKELDKTGIKLTATMSMEQIVDEMKKAYDKAQTTINKLGPIALQAKVNIQGLTDEDIEEYNNPLSFKYNPELYNTLKQLKGANDAKSQVDAAAKKRGLKLEGMKKDGTHKAEKQNQENAKAVREQVRIIKEAADAFEYWREKVGDKGAWEHMQSEFGDVLAKIGITADNIENVRGHLKKIPQTKEYKAIADKKVKTEIDKEIAKDNDQFIRKDFERDTERFLSKTQIELDNLTRAWETFNSVREATSNVRLAVELSGAQYAEGRARNLADAIKEKLQRDFAAAGVVSIPFDVDMDDEKIKEEIQKAMPKANEDQIKGFVEEYKKWRDLQRDVEQKDVETFAKLIGSAVDLQSELQKISDEYEKIIMSLGRMKSAGKITEGQYGQAKAIADANLQAKTVQAQNEYKFLMDGVTTMSKKAAQAIKRDYVNALQAQLRVGAITAKDYADKISAINDKMRELEDSPSYMQSYINGGLNGLFENIKKRGQGMREQGAAEYQAASKKYNDLMSDLLSGKSADFNGMSNAAQAKENASSMMEMGEGMESMGGEMMTTVAVIDMVIHGIDNLVQGLKNAVDQIEEMRQALGEETDPNSDWGKFSGYLGTFSKASSQATSGWDSLKNGDIGGAISGTIGSWTQWVTGLAKMNDAQHEARIAAMKREVDALEANTDAINRSRERTLGYDTGELRRRMSSLYEDLDVKNVWQPLEGSLGKLRETFGEYADVRSAAQQAMLDYYMKNSEGDGYAQQLHNLEDMRERYMKMYNEEAEKKDKSEESLLEYQKKIAELDDQIMNFSEDLFKEIWSVDIEGWADQLSDALVTAWENGEDAAIAFDDTVSDIMKNVVKNIMSVGYVQPLMKTLRESLFGDNGAVKWKYETDEDGKQRKTGIDWEASQEDFTKTINDALGDDGWLRNQLVNDFPAMMDSIQSSMPDIDLNGSGSSSSSSIKSITEQTADLLVAYVNAIRADVSVDRSMVAQYFPMYYDVMTQGNISLQNIENHTAAIMHSNDAIEKSNQAVLDRIDGLRNKTWKLPVC